MKKIVSNLPLMLNSLLVVKDDEEIKIDGLNTSPDLDHALSLAKSKKKPILVVFQQEDCEWCELLVDKVLSKSSELLLKYFWTMREMK